jgi:hypothetical protein
MSKKTIKQRIALVAVSALTAGFLSVVSTPAANATLAGDSFVLEATSIGICASDNATGDLSALVMTKSGTLVIDDAGALEANDTVKVSGSLVISSASLISGISIDQKKFTSAAGAAATVTFTATGAGTAVITTQTGGTGAAVQTINVTILDSCAGVNTPSTNTFSQVIDTAEHIQLAANSGTTTTTDLSGDDMGNRIFGDLSGGFTNIMNTSVDRTTSFANASTAYVSIMARDAYKNLVYGVGVNYGLTCTGSISVNGNDSNNGYIPGQAYGAIAQFTVAQNTANAPITTTCTASVNNVPVGTKVITFKGDLAKIESVMDTVGAQNTAAGDATAGTIKVKLFDSAGNRLDYNQPGIGTIGLTDTGSALVNAVSITTNTDASTTGVVSYNCVGSGKSGAVPVVLKATNSAGATISANSVTANCGGALETFTASLDKAVYNTGEVATLTISGLDANGKIVNDAVAMAGATISIGGMTAVVAPSTADTFSAGVKKYTYKVDTTTGNYVASVALTSGSAQAPVTIQVAIKSSSVGTTNEDVLKSIVALIASINKQIQALQKLILKRR